MGTKFFILLLLIPFSLYAEHKVSVTKERAADQIDQGPSIPAHEVALMNAIKARLELNKIQMPGEYTPTLCAITRKHNEVMRRDRVFSHNPSNYSLRSKNNEAIRAGGNGYAENIAWDNKGGTLEQRAERCATMWWFSRGHHANMVAKHGNYCHSMLVDGDQTWCTSGYSTGIKVGPVSTVESQTRTSELPSPLLKVGEKAEPNSPFPNLRLNEQAQQIHGKTIEGNIVPIHFSASGIPIGGARGEHTLADETVDDLYHYYQGRPSSHSRPLVKQFMSWAEKSVPQAEAWPDWKCVEAPEAKGLSPITKSSFEIKMHNAKGESAGLCTANVVKKHRLSDGSCEFALASAAHCMIPNEDMKNNNFSKHLLSKLETRFGEIPINGNLDFPGDYKGWMQDSTTSAKSDVALVRFRSACDTVADEHVLKIAESLPKRGDAFTLAKRDESKTQGTILAEEDRYGDVMGKISGQVGESGDSGGAIISNGKFVGVLGRSNWLPVGGNITKKDTFFRDVMFYRQGLDWIKRTLASCYGSQAESKIKPRETNREESPSVKPEVASTQKPDPKPNTPTSTTKPSHEQQKMPLSPNVEWRPDGMWGKDGNGNTVPLVIHNSSHDLLGGEKGEFQIPDSTKQELYDYVTKNPGRFSKAEMDQLRPFLTKWENRNTTPTPKPEAKPSTQGAKPGTQEREKSETEQKKQESSTSVNKPEVSTTAAFSDPLTQLDCKPTPERKFYSEARHGAVLADIFNHAVSPISGYVPIHLSGDAVTQGHESTHGINSVMRNMPDYLFSRRIGPKTTSGFGNAFYIEKGCTVVMPEPFRTRKDQVLAFVPKSLRFSRKDTYLVGQRAFNDRPLNIMDEFSAYINGSRVGVDQYKRGISKDTNRDTLTGAVEFIPMALALGMTLSKNEPDYFQKSPQFLTLLKVQIERAISVYREGSQIPGMAKKTERQVINNLMNSPDAAPMREWAKKTFGDEWGKAVLGV